LEGLSGWFGGGLDPFVAAESQRFPQFYPVSSLMMRVEIVGF
jgi:hypothetical protein